MASLLRAFVLAAGAGVLVAACGDDTSGSGSSQSSIPPSNCTEPCTAGDVCFGPAEPSCNGTWYCQSDQKWACQPPDAGGPGGFPDGTVGDDAAQEGAAAEGGGSDATMDSGGKGGKDGSKG